MNSTKTTDLKIIIKFIDIAYDLAVKFGAFEDNSFSSKVFIERVIKNGDYEILKTKSSKFEKIKYSYAYRRKSSSGKEANTSIVYYNLNFKPKYSNCEKNYFLICWPIHVMRKHNFCFDIENNKIFKLLDDYPSCIIQEMTLDDISAYLEMEYRKASTSTFKKIIPDVVGHNKNSLLMNPDDFRHHMDLCNMVVL